MCKDIKHIRSNSGICMNNIYYCILYVKYMLYNKDKIQHILSKATATTSDISPRLTLWRSSPLKRPPFAHREIVSFPPVLLVVKL